MILATMIAQPRAVRFIEESCTRMSYSDVITVMFVDDGHIFPRLDAISRGMDQGRSRCQQRDVREWMVESLNRSLKIELLDNGMR